MKRFLDLFFSLLLIVLLFPLMFLIGLLVTCSSRGGPFFLGPRVGRRGEIFKIIKFRSMKINSEGHGAWNISDHDKRVTPIGKVLRKTKLDELPQLFNIFIGQMSFVGYRPELQYYVDMYTEEEKKILDLRPGVTDWASIVNAQQVVFFTQTEDPDAYYLKHIRPLKIRLELYYRYHHSIIDDFRCVFFTVFHVFFHTKKLPAKIQCIVDAKQG
jgi:lipopolysaccharide/colanic/teichoic acid biosynthesis glycosyltransferase